MATVKEIYKAKRAEINQRLKKIDIALSKHAGKFKQNETNWGYIGDLGRVNEVLSELENFVKAQ